MARPIKQTVNYFPHDADASGRKTITILESRYGAVGYTCWFKLLEILAQTEGHVITCRNPVEMAFLQAKTLAGEKLEEILNLLATLEAIDAQLWSQKLIYSQNFVNNVASVYKNRRQAVPTRPKPTDKYCLECGKLLVEMREDAKFCSDECRQKTHRSKLSVTPTTSNNPVSTTNNPVSTGDNPITTGDNTQSRVEESKVNKDPLIPLPIFSATENSTKKTSGVNEEKPANISAIKKEPVTEQSPELTAVIKEFEACGGVIASQLIAQELADAEREYGSQIVIAGFRRAALQGKRGVRLIAYCQPIWDDYKANGIPQKGATNGVNKGRTAPGQMPTKYTRPEDFRRIAGAPRVSSTDARTG